MPDLDGRLEKRIGERNLVVSRWGARRPAMQQIGAVPTP